MSRPSPRWRRRDFEQWCEKIRAALHSPEHQARFDAMTEAEKEALIAVGLADGTLRYGSPYAEAIGVGPAPR